MNALLIPMIFLISLFVLNGVDGHGMMLNPPMRSSRWRFDSSAPPNYDDSGLYCGGFSNQYHSQGGKCGLCGDNYGSPTPRPNELGGVYGSGVIVKTYTSNSVKVGLRITANHLGYIYFNLCNLDQFGRESEDCFNKYRLRFADNSDKYYLGTTLGDMEVTVKLPDGLSCNHCVLRWTYYAGNNWGYCDDGTGAVGCGPQETFKNCADISIRKGKAGETVELPIEVLEDQA